MATTASRPATGVDSTPLRRQISRPMLTVFVIGDVLGAGIYALVGEVAGKVGGAIWTSFLLAGVLAAFTAASYAELVTKYPQAGGRGALRRTRRSGGRSSPSWSPSR